MVCEKYAKLITDDALGGLSPERAADLQEHLAQCFSCRYEFDHAKGIAARLDSGVEMLVAGEPSPQFAARLRARIASESSPARIDWRAWIPVAGGAIALAALLLGVMSRTPRPGNRTPSPLAQAASGPAAIVTAKNEKMATEGGSPRHRSMGRHVQPQHPEVLVPPGQLIAVMQLANALNTGQVEIDPTSGAQQQSEEPLEIEAIQISPLTIPELDDAGSGSPRMSGGL